ncbi:MULTISPECIES: NADPH-dependent FMN reductase [Bremerella]|uniref:NADPH-dependent FMN reductase n=1 Tax=Bremerella TaxID=2714594 RepID=UPI0031EF23F9
MSQTKILAFAGSARRDSYNKKLVAIAAKGAEEAGAEVTLVDLADFPMPIYDGDLEESQGIPENAQVLKELFLAHQGLLIACPEYNSSITPLLKNTIDWVSRPAPGEGPLAAYQGKVCSIMSASPGGLGGLRGLVSVRMILGNIGVVVLPKQMAISQANNAFADDGSLKDAKQQETVLSLGKTLSEFLNKMR